jgi:sulfate transport system substrate-binding protein
MRAVLALLLAVGCGSPAAPRRLVLAGYSAPNRVYEEALFPAFQARWQAERGERIEIVGSFRGSGAQVRALLEGYPADIAALALEPDLDALAAAGLLDSGWRSAEDGGMVATSLVALAVRPGNPKEIASWDDLTREDLTVLFPDVRTSGSARWNVAAIHGAVLRAGTASAALGPQVSEALLAGILARVPVMDAGARETMLRFEKGEGDAAITYESEVLGAVAQGARCELWVPPSTLVVEHPAAVLGATADAHGTRDLAEAFVAFLHEPEAQRLFAEHGFRPVDPAVLAAEAARFPAPPDVFTIRDLGGWTAVGTELLGPGGLYERAMQEAREAQQRRR